MRAKHKGPKLFIVIRHLNMPHFKMQIKITKLYVIIFRKHLAYFEMMFSWPFKSTVWMYACSNCEHSHTRLSPTLMNPVVLDFFVNFDLYLILLSNLFFSCVTLFFCHAITVTNDCNSVTKFSKLVSDNLHVSI